jgi:hypothetical protein
MTDEQPRPVDVEADEIEGDDQPEQPAPRTRVRGADATPPMRRCAPDVPDVRA